MRRALTRFCKGRDWGGGEGSFKCLTVFWAGGEICTSLLSAYVCMDLALSLRVYI